MAACELAIHRYLLGNNTYYTATDLLLSVIHRDRNFVSIAQIFKLKIRKCLALLTTTWLHRYLLRTTTLVRIRKLLSLFKIRKNRSALERYCLRFSNVT